MPHTYFLNEGEFSKADRSIKKIASHITNLNIPKLWAVQNLINGLEYKTNRKETDFRNRTASEIIKSGYTTGETDNALIYVTLARALGIPAAFVETINHDWFTQPSVQPKICSFADIYVHTTGWQEHNPSSGFCGRRQHDSPRTNYVAHGTSFVPIGTGLDFGAIHVEPLKTTIKLQSIESVMNIATQISQLNKKSQNLSSSINSYY